MDINDLSKEIEKLPKSERESILRIIDIKINNDMEKFISEIRSVKNDFESFESKIESKFESTNSRLSTVFWVIGIIGVVISVMLTILTLKN